LERLEDYKVLIQTATNDLEARLEHIDEKLEALMARTVTSSETTELHRIKDERSSTQKCLLICAQFSKLIDQVQLEPAEDPSRGSGFIPEKITSDGIQECKISVDQTTARLESHMQDILDQIMAKSGSAMTQEDTRYLTRLREEWKTARQCRDICSKADQNLKENISVIDNHATGNEALQFLVSNSQKTIHGKNRGYGDHIKQVGGHLSDQSIQKLSGDFLQMVVQRSGGREISAHDDKLSKGNDAEKGRANWQPQYGGGRTLQSRPHNFAVSQKSSGGAGSDNT
jgi:hypothetical protein